MPVTNIVVPQYRPYQPVIPPSVDEPKKKSDLELLFGDNPFTSKASSSKEAAVPMLGLSSDQLFK